MKKKLQIKDKIKRGFKLLFGIFYRAILDFREEKIYFQANALAYRSLLSLVPFLAFLFSFIALFKKMVDVDLESKLEQLLSQYLLPNSAVGKMVLDQVLAFVQNAKAGSYLGFILLLGTSIFLFNAIDRSINLAFKQERQRNFFQRAVLFTAILVWGTLLVGLSLYFTAKVQFSMLLEKLNQSGLAQETRIENFFQSLVGLGEKWGSYFLSFLMILLALFLLYKIFPKIYVESRASWFGAFWGALFWELSKWGFSFSATWMLKSREKIYASLAVFLVFLVWMYLTWVIVLFGAELTYIFQHYRYEAQAFPLKKTRANRLWLGFLIMLEVGLRFLRGEEPPSIKEFAQRFGVGIPELKEITDSLEKAHLLNRIASSTADSLQDQFQPGKELDNIYLSHLVSALDPNWNLEEIHPAPSSDPKLTAENKFLLELFQKLKAEFDEYLARKNLKQILVEEILSAESKENP